MEVHAAPSSAIHIIRREEEEHSVAPLPPQQWGKELCSLQTRFDRFNINIEGGAQSDSSCCSAITCEGCCQTSFDSDSASGVPVDGAAGDQTSEGCREEGFGNSQVWWGALARALVVEAGGLLILVLVVVVPFSFLGPCIIADA